MGLSTRMQRLWAVGIAAMAAGALASTAAADTVTTTFQSQFGWPTYSADPAQGGSLLGPSEEVCLRTSGTDPRCPGGGVAYGTPGPGGWPVDLSAYPLAHFIWAPGVTGNTFPADLASYAFSRTFYLPGAPVAGTIQIATDDFAEVHVNGAPVGSIGSVTDIFAAADAQSYLHTIDLTPYLHRGSNQITIVVQNGPASYPAVCDSGCSYAQNPAMVVFAGQLASSTS